MDYSRQNKISVQMYLTIYYRQIEKNQNKVAGIKYNAGVWYAVTSVLKKKKDGVEGWRGVWVEADTYAHGLESGSYANPIMLTQGEISQSVSTVHRYWKICSVPPRHSAIPNCGLQSSPCSVHCPVWPQCNEKTGSALNKSHMWNPNHDHSITSA